MKKFPHIEQFENVVQTVKQRHDYVEETDSYENTSPYPTLNFTGSVKICGTNAGIELKSNGEIICQSRKQMISLADDHHGFSEFVTNIPSDVLRIITPPTNSELFIGEWCGEGIRNGHAIHQLSKRFIIFDMYHNNGEEYIREDRGLSIIFSPMNIKILNDNNIFFVDQFRKYSITIDFNSVEDAAKKLEEYTTGVEKSCPVGKHFNVDGHGEGIVWRCVEDPSPDLWFKTVVGEHKSTRTEKAAEHKSTRTEKAAEVDPTKVKNIEKFVEFAATEQRFEQTFNSLKGKYKSINKKSTSEFLRQVSKNIAKKCASDLEKSELTMEDVNKAIEAKALKWLNGV